MRLRFAPLVLVLLAPSVSAQLIDFETVPPATPTTDLQSISNQYAAPADGGVLFSLVNSSCNNSCSGSPIIAKVGPPRTAFQGPAGTSFAACGVGNTDNDMPNVADQGRTSCSFLTDDALIGPNPCAMQVDYVNPVLEASGILLDIDGAEQWTLTAFDGAIPVDTQVVNPPGGDGFASPWVLDPPGTQPFDRLVLDYTGGCNTNVGLAFDRFNTSSATDLPVLSTRMAVLLAVLLALALLVLQGLRLRRSGASGI